MLHSKSHCRDLFFTNHWFRVKNKHHRQFDASVVSLRPWLLAQGSLTQQLKSFAGGEFHVLPLHQSLQQPMKNEARLLRMKPAQYAWVREVYLYGNDDEPWVHARSVIPLTTLRGSGRRLRKLKSRSLGSILFERGGVQLMPLVKQMKSRQVAKVSEGWTRRTAYHWHGKHLLVQETFLPAFIDALQLSATR
ncbi:chorismate--pyruvate lyase family protein [Aquirhabdus sp.]|uniref:chorismate--pyruvate lyase family protein n=1 Tax=Aquirhabdus sp. TaxID=2824160 RepID=UPI00396CBAC7